MNKSQQFNIGLSSWIIQDGNYDDFSVGQIRRFALEIHPLKLEKTSQERKAFACLEECRYALTGQIVHGGIDSWMLDFGLTAFHESKIPIGCKVGEYISTEAYLLIDPFFYFETLSKQKGVPSIIYEWRIDAIKMEVAPFIEKVDELGRKTIVRDQSRLGMKNIPRTDAWKDDKGLADYLLTCSRVGDESWNRI